MSDKLDNVETCNNLIPSGLCIDLYLQEIAKGISSNLSRNSDSLNGTYEIFVPWPIMKYIADMCIGYGADFTDNVFTVKNESTADKIFNKKRFNGTDYLFYKKENIPNDGCAKVLISIDTPLRFEYVYEENKLYVSFTIQR